MDVKPPRTPRKHWWKVEGDAFSSTRAMLDKTNVPPEGRVVTYGFKNYDEVAEIKGIIQGTTFYPHGESSEGVDLRSYARTSTPIGSDWPLWKYGLVGAGLGAATVLSQFIPLVGILGPTAVGAPLGHHAARGAQPYGWLIGGAVGAAATGGVIYSFNHWDFSLSFLPVMGAAVGLGAVLGLCLGRRIHNHAERKEHAKGQWWDRAASAPQVPAHPLNSAAAGLNLGLDYARTHARLEAAGLPEPAHRALHKLLQHSSSGGWIAEPPWRRTQTGAGLAWCRPVDSGPHKGVIVTPAIDLAKPEKLTLSSRFRTPGEFDQGPTVKVESCSDGESWKAIGSFWAGETWHRTELDLQPGRLQLRFSLSAGSQTGELQMASLAIGETWRDGKDFGPQALIDLAVCPELPLEKRTHVLEHLAGMPEGVGWAVLHHLGAKKLRLEDLPALIERLPSTLVARDVEAAIQRVLEGPVGKAISERNGSVLIGGVRVKTVNRPEA